MNPVLNELLNIGFVILCLLGTGFIFKLAAGRVRLEKWMCPVCGDPKDGWRFSSSSTIVCSGCGLPVHADGKPTVNTKAFDRHLGLDS